MKKCLELIAAFIAKSYGMIEINLLLKMIQYRHPKIKTQQEFGFNYRKVKLTYILMTISIENFPFLMENMSLNSRN
jgi:hypothetical protein